jgi:hypothetical protein
MIRDVSALGNVHELKLSACYNITDVSALGNVHELNLSACYNITDVSALGNVHELNITVLLFQVLTQGTCVAFVNTSRGKFIVPLFYNCC